MGCRRICWIGRMSCCNGHTKRSQRLGEPLRVHDPPRLVQVFGAIEKSRPRITADVRPDQDVAAIRRVRERTPAALHRASAYGKFGGSVIIDAVDATRDASACELR